MNIRRTTSLTALLSFVLVLVTSVVLYITPHGRVAYWADWRFWGLSKEQWGDIHVLTGLLFLIALFLHIYYNWRLILNYLKNRSGKLKVFTPEFSVALLITAAFVLGAYFETPPFNYVLTLNDALKERSAEKYGEPPYGHAELSSVKTLALRTGLDWKQALVKLREAGYEVESEGETIADIARRRGATPQQVFNVIKTAQAAPQVDSADGGAMPLDPPPGLGRRTLADLAGEYDLNLPAILSGLADRGLKAEPEATIKSIAAAHGQAPVEVYMTVRELAAGK